MMKNGAWTIEEARAAMRQSAEAYPDTTFAIIRKANGHLRVRPEDNTGGWPVVESCHAERVSRWEIRPGFATIRLTDEEAGWLTGHLLWPGIRTAENPDCHIGELVLADSAAGLPVGTTDTFRWAA